MQRVARPAVECSVLERNTARKFPEQMLAAIAAVDEFSADSDAARGLAQLRAPTSARFAEVLRALMCEAAAVGRVALIKALFAAAAGHTKVLKTLRAFGLTADDARANDNQALRGAAGRGHYAVVVVPSRIARSWCPLELSILSR